MTESDDFLSGGGVDIPKQKAATPTKTAEALPQESETARKNKRLSASLLTKDFAEPKLGIPGLDAIKQRQLLG